MHDIINKFSLLSNISTNGNAENDSYGQIQPFFADRRTETLELSGKKRTSFEMLAISLKHQIFMQIGTIHLQSVYGSNYENHNSNLSSFEDIIPNVLKVVLFQYHKALITSKSTRFSINANKINPSKDIHL